MKNFSSVRAGGNRGALHALVRGALLPGVLAFGVLAFGVLALGVLGLGACHRAASPGDTAREMSKKGK